MTPERMLWQLVKPYFPGHVERVENVANVGTPDVNLCYGGKETWVELKVSDKKGQEPLDLLNPSQKIWHLRRVQQIGRVYVLIREGSTLLLYKASNSGSRVEASYALVWSGIKPWNWQFFQDVLKSL